MLHNENDIDMLLNLLKNNLENNKSVNELIEQKNTVRRNSHENIDMEVYLLFQLTC